LIVLSHYQVKRLLTAREEGRESAETSPDLNRTTVTVMLDADGIRYPDGERLSWPDAETIAESENACFLLEEGAIQDIKVFSETTNWVRTLYPTEGAPTTLVSGLTMHRIEGIDPYQDTLNKIKAARPVVGSVLDTATGLGYTAIEAAKTAEHVLTVEIDPTSLEIARFNPWSGLLFDNPKIEQVIGHVWDVVEEIDDETFSCILHDPPAFSLAGDLYAGDFYRELYRVLRRKGRLFHYIGDPASRTVQRTKRGVVERLTEAGFSRVVEKRRAFGVTAYK
jgi:predicted methyltransferase